MANSTTDQLLDTILSSGDYYDILGVARDASVADIRKMYLKTSMKVHPDKHAATQDKSKASKAFVKLKEAYDTLSDDISRLLYDSAQARKSFYTNNHSTTFGQRQQQPGSAEDASREAQRQKQEQQQRRQQEEQKRCEEQQRRRRQEEERRRQQQEEKRRQEERQRQEQDEKKREEERRAREQHQQRYRQPKTFGTTVAGEPCKKCIQLGCFCHLHKHQDPRRQPMSTTSTSTSTSSSSVPRFGSTSTLHTRHFGINKTNGEPCKNCIKQQGYCHHHKDQDPQFYCQTTRRQQQQQQQQQTNVTPSIPQYVPFGRRKDGQACLICEKKQGLCHFHMRQRR